MATDPETIVEARAIQRRSIEDRWSREQLAALRVATWGAVNGEPAREAVIIPAEEGEVAERETETRRTEPIAPSVQISATDTLKRAVAVTSFGQKSRSVGISTRQSAANGSKHACAKTRPPRHSPLMPE